MCRVLTAGPAAGDGLGCLLAPGVCVLWAVARSLPFVCVGGGCGRQAVLGVSWRVLAQSWSCPSISSEGRRVSERVCKGTKGVRMRDERRVCILFDWLALSRIRVCVCLNLVDQVDRHLRGRLCVLCLQYLRGSTY